MDFISLNSIEKLKNIAKSEEELKNDPSLCALLENPYLKIDTNLAIKYNDYKNGDNSAAKDFINDFYENGPNIETDSLVEWVDTIKKDEYLNELATQYESQELNKDYSSKIYPGNNETLSQFLDCLNMPCSYISPISPNMGSIGDTNRKYSLKNSKGTEGEEIVSTGIPSYILNRLPKTIVEGMQQLVSMTASQISSTKNVILTSSKAVKEDPYIIPDAEVIGSDILASIADSTGDCFRLYSRQRLYNPYDYDKNQAQADLGGKIVYDENNKPKLVTMTGNELTNSSLYNTNKRLEPNNTHKSINMSTITNAKKIWFDEVGKDLYLVPFSVSSYNAVVTSDGQYYSDNTQDKDGQQGLTASWSKYNILPDQSIYYNKARENGNLTYYCGVATRAADIKAYFSSMFKTKYPDKQLPDNFDSIIRTAYKGAQTFAVYNFPSELVILPVIDTGGGGPKGQHKPWTDITAQFFLTDTGANIGYLTAGKEKIESPSGMPLSLGSSEWPEITKVGAKHTGLKLNGIDYNNGFLLVDGMFFFSNEFCRKNNLDPLIYGSELESLASWAS